LAYSASKWVRIATANPLQPESSRVATPEAWRRRALRTTIRPSTAGDFETILAIVNDAARAYKGVIPADRWHEPYVPPSDRNVRCAGGSALV
jgi:hypothetical protein